MADVNKCPVCGKSNPPGQEFCLYCQSRLEPFKGALKGADAPIKPGQMPTKKNTAELEPLLPQWLRDARDSARKSADNDSSHEERQKQESFTASPSFDLLTGLQSQKGSNDEEEELPDWLASITGDSPKSKNDQDESSEVRWVELGGANDFAQEEKPKVESNSPKIAPAQSQANEKDDLNDWFQEASGFKKTQQPEQPSVPDSSFYTPPASSDTPDWLRKMAADSESQNDRVLPIDSGNASASSDTQDWLRNLAAEDGSQNNTIKDADNTSDAGSALPVDEPDWLRALGGSQDQARSAEPPAFSEAGSGIFEAAESPSADKLPEWMQNLPLTESDKPKQNTVPKWLTEGIPASSAGIDVPAWLSGLPGSDSAAPETGQLPAPTEDNSSFGDLPNWLNADAPQSSNYSDQPQVPASAPSPDTPSWLSTPMDAPQMQSKPAFSADEALDSESPAFNLDAQASYNMDELFTNMPDWLSKAADSSNSSNLSPITNSDSIVPGELPSWVQAMRPVDSPEPPSSFSGDQTLESRGALAGLQGVLPAVAGYVTTSKPKAYSIKLQASEEQQAHAALLEQILASETAPVPIASFSSLQTSRGLRWVITFIFFAILAPISFLNTQIFAMPAGVPREINGALQVVQSIPESAPVLVAFDYEPARVGEMEAAATPLFNLLRKPSLTFISTNQIGGILAERFITRHLAGLSDESGIQYLNLGYLPGGQMGIRAFAQNPPAATPFDVTLAGAWTSPQLQGITSLSQFAALIIITDNANSARAWIEQTSTTRGTIPVVVISSAQAAPMIQPYYDSQQISGLVTGIYGGAVLEQTNGGIPGTTRIYWDAYSIGMLLAMALILGGGLLNLAVSLRDRVAAREAK